MSAPQDHLSVDGAQDGESFYFFDIDDNLLFLPTTIVLTDTRTGARREVSTGEYATVAGALGKPGAWLDWSDSGAFVNFEDPPAPAPSPFLADIRRALDGPSWRGPSWRIFEHACALGRPTVYITARGHAPESIRAGLALLAEAGAAPCAPNVLAVFPVGHPDVARDLAAMLPPGVAAGTAALKRCAIRRAVARAVEVHGDRAPHRFGMSDDDPRNVHDILFAMLDCKRVHPQMRFFVIDTHEAEHMKLEVFPIDMPAPRGR